MAVRKPSALKTHLLLFFFYKGEEVGRIIESPLTSLEVDLRNIVVKK